MILNTFAHALKTVYSLVQSVHYSCHNESQKSIVYCGWAEQQFVVKQNKHEIFLLLEVNDTFDFWLN